MKMNLPYKEIKFMSPHEYAMRKAWEEKRRENCRRIQKVAGTVVFSSILLGWLTVVLAGIFS